MLILLKVGMKDQKMIHVCISTNTFILVWVDDLLIAAKPNVIESVRRVFTKMFEMKDLGQIALFLGIEFDVDSVNNTISMSQEKYAKKLLHKFGMQDSEPRYTPCEVKSNVINETLLDENDANLYRQIVGCLIYSICLNLIFTT